MTKTTITKNDAKEMIQGKLSRYFGVTPSDATVEQVYKSTVVAYPTDIENGFRLPSVEEFEAKLAAAHFRNALHLFPTPDSGWTPKVLTYSGFYGLGIKEIWDKNNS